MSRFDIRSTDGTPIAVWVEGDGPALVMVHGSIADHTTFDPFVDVLRRDLTTFSLDRRGFGASGDAPDYSIERDFEDVAAVVDAVADRAGGPVALFGHSYGANCALGAATITTSIEALVLYEPSLGLAYPPGLIDSIEQAVDAGDTETAIATVLVDIAGMTEDDIEVMRTTPLWPVRLAAAPTIARECRAEESWSYEPGRFEAITVPTLLLTGSETPSDLADATRLAADAIPGAKIRVLDGHGHMAHKADPELVAKIIRQFIEA